MYSKNKIFLILLLILTVSACNDSDDDDSSKGFVLSGRVWVASNTAKDNDVNDSMAPNLDNNSRYTAQVINNPIILGGYVNQPFAGSTGQTYQTGDINDFFEVELSVGQIISLFVANDNLFGNDLDLALLDRNGSILNVSVGDGRTESLIVPADGRYFIQVQAHRGASNYILSIGQNVSTTSFNMRLSDDFAPGEIIAQFSPQSAYKTQSAIATLNMSSQSQDVSRRMLLSLEPDSQMHALAIHEMNFATPQLRLKYETLLAIKQLRRRSDILEASPNYRFQALRVPNDTLYRYQQWNHALINLPQAWETTRGDSSVIVAVVDSGVLMQHPDLKTKLFQGYDFVASRQTELDGDRGIDSDPNDPGDQFPGGSSFHGTHVAGIIGALTDNEEGIAGVGWLTKIMPLRALGKGGEGFDYDIEQAIRFAAGLPNDSGTVPTQSANIINLSLGSPVFSSGLQKLIAEVQNQGIIVVAAAGNEDTNIPMFPASLEGVISVGAIDINKRRASYSNFGADVDLVAPGGDNTPDINGDGMPDGILSTMGDEQRGSRLKLEYSYQTAMGTSMAAPHVAGVIALMKAVNPTLTPQDFNQLLRRGQITNDLGPVGRDDDFGYGLVNAQKAVLAALEGGSGEVPEPSPPLLVVNPKSLNFGFNVINAQFTISNGGGSDLWIENINEDSGGFLSIEGSGLGNYTVRVDRSRLNQGTFTATITITTNANSATIPVILQVVDSNVAGDAGLHYILLIEPGTLETVQEISVSAVDGFYHFWFDNVPAGKYLIAAGSDFNNDGFICDVGEACGAFLTLDRPTSVEVTNHRSEVDFSSSFNVNFLSSQSIGAIKTPSVGFARLKQKHALIW